MARVLKKSLVFRLFRAFMVPSVERVSTVVAGTDFCKKRQNLNDKRKHTYTYINDKHKHTEFGSSWDTGLFGACLMGLSIIGDMKEEEEENERKRMRRRTMLDAMCEQKRRAAKLSDQNEMRETNLG